MPCQNALQKWPRNPSCPPNALPKRPTKVAPKPKLPSKMPCQNALQKWPRNPSCPPKCPAKNHCQNALQK